METIFLIISKEDHKIIPRTNLKWNSLPFKNWNHIALSVIHTQNNKASKIFKSCDNVIKRNGWGLFCYCNWKMLLWVSVPMQRKEVYSDAMWPGRIVYLCLKDHIPFLLKPAFLIGIGRKRVVFLSNYLASFWSVQVMPIHLSVSWCAQCKSLPLCYLGQWWRFPGAMTV